VDLLIRLFAKEYGHAQFVPGMGEVSATSASDPKTSLKSAVVPPVINAEATTALENEGFSWLQKGLFFSIILGCVVAYFRRNTKTEKRYLAEKSLV